MENEAMKFLEDAGYLVLATAGQGQPLCSLMACVAGPGEGRVHMAAETASRKYANMLENPWVSLLADTRDRDFSQGPGGIRAMTLSGTFSGPIPGEAVEAVREKFLSRHPGMGDFLDRPGVVFFAVALDSWDLLEGPSRVVSRSEFA
ncbi:MAG: pyridoxamine 5'-phosphate oxidase family protein [Proteobacteria bacterium]|nr:pyridoxamine 5'-phosphate oxidase family protein [Pseudomonadota bacterium]